MFQGGALLGFAVDQHNDDGRDRRDDNVEDDCECGHVRRPFRLQLAPLVL
jgi:hypothetical protein